MLTCCRCSQRRFGLDALAADRGRQSFGGRRRGCHGAACTCWCLFGLQTDQAEEYDVTGNETNRGAVGSGRRAKKSRSRPRRCRRLAPATGPPRFGLLLFHSSASDSGATLEASFGRRWQLGRRAPSLIPTFAFSNSTRPMPRRSRMICATLSRIRDGCSACSVPATLSSASSTSSRA